MYAQLHKMQLGRMIARIWSGNRRCGACCCRLLAVWPGERGDSPQLSAGVAKAWRAPVPVVWWLVT
ncbi:hypothetical protein LNP74_25545 [Klebsiella pneumoniae subsp. pneumoniae]|nr:hypothetical protein [Klebsiella pneumoniae subsp. pneumoniae]